MTAAELLDRLRTRGLLTADRADEASTWEEAQLADPKPLGRAILQRGWLSAAEINAAVKVPSVPPPPPPPLPPVLQPEPEEIPDVPAPRTSRRARPAAASALPLILGGVAAAVVLVGGAVAAYLMLVPGPKPPPVEKQGPAKDKNTRPKEKPVTPTAKAPPRPKKPARPLEVVAETVGTHSGLNGHEATPQALAVTADGKVAATGDESGLIRTWEVEPFRAQRALAEVPGSVRWLTFSPDGKQLAAAANDAVYTFDVATGEAKATHAIPARCFTPDLGEALGLESRGAAGVWRRWKLPAGTEAGTIDAPAADADGVAFSPDGSRLAVLYSNQMVEAYALADGRRLARLNDGEDRDRLTGVGWSADGSGLLLGTPDGLVYRVPLAPEPAAGAAPSRAGVKLGQPTYRAIRGLLAADEDRVILNGADSYLCLWSETRPGLLYGTLAGGRDECTRVVRVPASKRVLSTHADGSLWLWRMDRPNGRTPARQNPGPDPVVLRRFVQHAGPVTGVAFLPDGELMTFDFGSHRWDVKGVWPATSVTGHLGFGTCFALSGDGRRGLIGCDGPGLVLISPRAAKIVFGDNTFELIRKGSAEGGLTAVAFSPDGGRAVYARGGLVRDERTRVLREEGKVRRVPHELCIMDLEKRREVRRLPLGPDAAHSVAFSGDGKRVLASTAAAPLLVWDAEAGTPLPGWAKGEARRMVPLGPDRAAVGLADGAVVLWDVAGAKEVGRLGPNPGPVTALAVSPDGKRLVLAGGGELRVWEVAGAKLVGKRPLRTTATAVAVSADGAQALVGTEDGVAELLDLKALAPPGP